MTGPTLVFLHALGASAEQWKLVLDHLPTRDCVALDLPGYGAAARRGYLDVGAMADWLADEIRSRALVSCVLVGHSMGGKIVTLVAARAARGEIGLSGVLGVVLVAASPPSPEPMDEDRRAEMIGWFADNQASWDEAATFVDANTATRLADALRTAAIEDVQRSSREAWLGWLERGSREDWSAAAGRITIPARIIAGADDGDLGEDAQRRLNLPHYITADVQVVQGAAHLIPYEQPEVLASLLEGHVARVAQAELPPAFARLLASDRVSRRTRVALMDRMRPPPETSLWTAEDRATATATVAQILPDAGEIAVLADRILASIADGAGDGWRFAALPPDREAWQRGLATLATGGFATLGGDAQTRLLERVADGAIGSSEDAAQLSPEQMALWFEDVRAETVRVWMSLPATMVAIGYDGFAVGGDGRRKQGYTRTAADDLETWQPSPERMS
ncbi:alpha/beta hydrolase [Sphingomonas sp. BAUL-RG-20F-R05-02]|uniref:alpha/beta hydrolase n=1 Tax=Sphingomonas sp. BAUL-RG-20F-R05-02 TaxID=2914830 RepID=UPI001F58CE05|nr:alpha/beta hydrolase [Sphingomonas sp. BAUL-RG-20F-R05-02]